MCPRDSHAPHPRGNKQGNTEATPPRPGGSPQRDKGQGPPAQSKATNPARPEPTATGLHQSETRPDPRRGARHAPERPEPPQPPAPTGQAMAHHDDPAYRPQANPYTPWGRRRGATAAPHPHPSQGRNPRETGESRPPAQPEAKPSTGGAMTRAGRRGVRPTSPGATPEHPREPPEDPRRRPTTHVGAGQEDTDPQCTASPQPGARSRDNMDPPTPGQPARPSRGPPTPRHPTCPPTPTPIPRRTRGHAVPPGPGRAGMAPPACARPPAGGEHGPQATRPQCHRPTRTSEAAQAGPKGHQSPNPPEHPPSPRRQRPRTPRHPPRSHPVTVATDQSAQRATGYPRQPESTATSPEVRAAKPRPPPTLCNEVNYWGPDMFKFCE
ncbi:proline-rich protein HaeIII subfamily 1-like [Plectropomus leopardus]|uniref:proline-rich protein HaeIII subfamily 1-like n=1 Tax=Plectropomus leopardus TaxID=160734 RepID=UPI001C4B1B57|nr:proline-rich protein HaeIII subfamily 1-like [Plectropomus leopardus]